MSAKEKWKLHRNQKIAQKHFSLEINMYASGEKSEYVLALAINQIDTVEIFRPFVLVSSNFVKQVLPNSCSTAKHIGSDVS